MEINTTAQILLYLLNCAVNEKKPENLPKDTDYDALLKLSKFHSVRAMVAMALDNGGMLSEPYMTQEQIKEWAAIRVGAMRRNIMFDAEREQILKYMDEQGIWYMPLKGCILKDLYPDIGMREMADNDILFDGKCRTQIRDYMLSRGYKVEAFNKSVHDVYMKQPFYNFEFHVALFSEMVIPEWGAYYGEVKNRLQKDENNQYGYHFTDEDFYIYMMAHAYKHYSRCGTGIRLLTDVYVYLSKKGEEMDWSYIHCELKKLGMDEFEESCRALAERLFSEKVGLDDLLLEEEKEMEMLSYLMGSGTYGTVQNKVRKDMDTIQEGEGPITFWTKVKFCLRRLFPGVKHMKMFHPFCMRHPWSIPFFWVYRIFRVVFKRGQSLMAEIRAVKKVK